MDGMDGMDGAVALALGACNAQVHRIHRIHRFRLDEFVADARNYSLASVSESAARYFVCSPAKKLRNT